MKEQIKDYLMQLGADDVGFAAVESYQSPRSPEIMKLYPEAKTIIVAAMKEMAHCESASPQMATNGRLDIMAFARSVNFQLGKFLERKFKGKSMSLPLSFPLDMTLPLAGMIGEVSMRHAAVAAGLGVFGRHNLVIHPQLGSQVLFCGVLTDLFIEPDSPMNEELCTDCDICIENCPAGALDEEGKTDVAKCLKNAQPFGMGRAMAFWSKFAQSSPEEQKKMARSEEFMKIYHIQSFGMHYVCFNCMTSCPIGQ